MGVLHAHCHPIPQEFRPIACARGMERCAATREPPQADHSPSRRKARTRGLCSSWAIAFRLGRLDVTNMRKCSTCLPPGRCNATTEGHHPRSLIIPEPQIPCIRAFPGPDSTKLEHFLVFVALKQVSAKSTLGKPHYSANCMPIRTKAAPTIMPARLRLGSRVRIMEGSSSANRM